MLRSLFISFGFLYCAVAFSQNELPVHHQKLAYTLNEAMNKRFAGDSMMVSISIAHATAIVKLKKFMNINFVYGESSFTGKIRISDLPKLAQEPGVIFISPASPAKEELTTGAYDLTLNKVNYAQARFQHFTGDSLQASIKERLFDTTDIDLTKRIFKTGAEASTQTPHASLMATMVAGGANSSPFAKGVAPKANLTSASFSNLFPEHDSIFQRYKISVQNHSYGTVVENFYGNEAAAYDRQSSNIPILLHVFSSGNSGNVTNATGPYAGVQQFANLTGNFKHAKNVMIVGSIDSAGQLMLLSSKGPAHDGRVKPELMAYGEDGSSGAAATVSGTALLVQHAYKQTHSANLPFSSLVKAVMLNSANDIGNLNVDYLTGYGNLDAYKAITTINENRYFENAVVQDEVKTFNLAVPAGLSKLKLTLTWNDPAASPNAIKALTNDLDALLKLPATNESWQPWVLDHSPNAASLQMPAQRKKDTLNNVEQITIDDPVAGNYSIEIRGSKITTANQLFSIAYQYDTANIFYWTYPTSSDPLIAGNIHWLRWETNVAGTGEIEYATNGNNWRTAGNVADLSTKYFRWTLPDTVTTAILRMKVQANASTILSDTFTISPQLKMDVGFNCADSFLLYWNSLPTNGYAVYELNDKYLEQFSQSMDTSVILNKAQHASLYYSVAPLINGRQGIRSNTINYVSAGPECYIKSFFLQLQTSSAASFTAELGTLFNVTEVGLEKLGATGSTIVQNISNPVSVQFSFTDPSLMQGENRYRLRVKLVNGVVLYSTIEIAYHLPASPVVLYPNPVLQNSLLNVITNESGRFTLQIFDDNGRMLYNRLLVSSLSKINTAFFTKGLYVIRIIDRDGKPFSQKLIIY